MRNLFFLSLAGIFLLCGSYSASTDPFSTYFTDGSLRIDYFHSGNAETEEVSIDRIYNYNQWSGSKKNLIDETGYGKYIVKIYDQESGELIFSRGFDSYFMEYQTTDPAIEGIKKQFHESAIIPFPAGLVVFSLEKRNTTGTVSEVFRQEIDPKDALSPLNDPTVKVFTSLENGNPENKADILIVGEGYRSEEESKFLSDLEKYTEVFFMQEPGKSYSDRFNVRGVLKPSEESGVDEPRAGIDVNTAVNASFNAFGLERYLLTEDNKSLRDIAGHAPYDAIFIMVNHGRYGGGGIYNFYCVFTADNNASNYLLIHESGHSFYGLADEYYNSSVAYNDFHPLGYEPVEPNITALVDPENLKWKHLLSEGIEIPTPWGKESYDSLENGWQQRRAELNTSISIMKKEGKPYKEIKALVDQYNNESREVARLRKKILENPDLKGKVGAFEGAAYVSEGFYRPSLNCTMFSHADYFCPVCRDAMIKMIMRYSE